MTTLPSVAETFAGKSVFITGFTGFFGKTLVEKLLRDSPDISTIYLLVRPSKDKAPQQRVEEILQGILFDLIRQKDPHFDRKVKAIAGDLAKPFLGVKSDDPLLAEIREKVSFIFHCAATVNFNERLDISLNTNVLSVHHLIGLAKSLNKLEAFVHVSTAYAHCDRKHIEEKFYPPTVNPLALAEAVQSMPLEAVGPITAPLVGKRPNTYTFTKSLAEAVLKEEGTGLPAAVVRPSVVGCLTADPLPGWTDNINGPAGIYLAAGHGILRAVVCNEGAVFDMVPVDHCINMIIAVAWKLAVKKPHLITNAPTTPSTSTPTSETPSGETKPVAYNEPLVFNCVSCNTRPLKLSHHNEIVQEIVRKNPFTKSVVKRPYVAIVTEFQFKWFFNPVYHVIPAVIYDLFRRLQGKKPMMRKIYSRLNASINAYAFFTTQGWIWDDENSKQLMRELSDADRKTYNMDLTTLSWETYLNTYYEGCRKFLITNKKSSMSGSSSSSSSSAPLGQSANTSPSTPSLSVFNTPEVTPSTTPTNLSRSSSQDNLYAQNNNELLTKSNNSNSSSSSETPLSAAVKTKLEQKTKQNNSNNFWKVTTVVLLIVAVLITVLWDLIFENENLVATESGNGNGAATNVVINKTSNPFVFIARLFKSVLDSN